MVAPTPGARVTFATSPLSPESPRDPTRSPHEKVGFPDSYREGKAEDILRDVGAKLPALLERDKAVLDIGTGCSDVATSLVALCGERGHRVALVCTGPTADLINREGTVVRFPIKGRESLLDVSSKQLPGALSAATPDEVDPGRFDLAVLGMQQLTAAVSGAAVARSGTDALAAVAHATGTSPRSAQVCTPPPCVRRAPTTRSTPR